MSNAFGMWLDRDSRIWTDSGQVDPKSNEPIIELLNGKARGTLSWVSKEFGPLEEVRELKRS